MSFKSCRKQLVLTLLFSLFIPVTSSAQEKVEAKVEATLVSKYIWRGIDFGGVSIQPTLTVEKNGLSLNAWGSAGFDKDDSMVGVLYAEYKKKGFKISLVDYWCDKMTNKETGEVTTGKYFDYKAHSTLHFFEAALKYDFGFAAIQWNTFFAGSDYYKANGDRAYSTYIELSAPFRIKEIDFSAEVGFTPWEGYYSNKFNVTNLSLKATKDIKITDSFTLPIFTKVIFNPYTEGAYFVFGATL